MQETNVKPYITEKSLDLASHGWYAFKVNVFQNKAQIAESISKQYAVTVTDVRIERVAGKSHRVGRRMRTAQRSDWKKALVKLEKGQTIAAFTVTHEGEKKSIKQ